MFIRSNYLRDLSNEFVFAMYDLRAELEAYDIPTLKCCLIGA